ncbi:hypothetical protein EHP00_641 [Ecytonucleospora hepatopenaei]|uniref:Uncharacterized protein n=1 Tax=Ecytonucleospora hepatopenaei TaxID=646526 RepID=A0A1W0E8I3_9MICR|nr:hypothetical protein EHP00_641 [Ecytonucleospora hepatopenaei]
MAIFKDVYMVFVNKNDVFPKNEFIVEKIKENYGLLGLSDVFYLEIKEKYVKSKHFIVWCPRNCQKMIEKCLEKHSKLLCKSGTLKRAKSKIIKIIKNKNI